MEKKRERLAKLQHKQWSDWVRYMLKHLSIENISRWQQLANTPYEQLADHQKISDRFWANKIIQIFKKKPIPTS